MSVKDPSRCGTITFEEPETVEIASSGNPQQKTTITKACGRWQPPERLRQFLPENYSIPIERWIGPDGLRRFVLGCPFEELIEYGREGGLAVLQGLREFDGQMRQSYRHMSSIFDYVRGRGSRGERGMQEHVTRNFDYSRDLHVRRSGRVTDSERDVLPDRLGLTAAGEGRHWSVKELMSRGRQAGQDAGYENPTSKHAIAFGLFEGAGLDPAQVKAKEVPQLVRLAAFDIEPSDCELSPELLDIVTERLIEAIHNRPVESADQFYQWFSGPSNSLVKQIAQQKGKPGGKLDHQDVRRALLELGWRAYEYVGQCINALMRTIKLSIPNPLTQEEQQLFERVYESQAYYGNMPLALLAERMAFLRRAILAIWDEPQNERHIAVLHRMLQYYAEMATKRRQADRQSKDRSSRDKGESMGTCDVIEDSSVDEHERPPAEDVNGDDKSSGSGCEGPIQVGGGSVGFNENLHSRDASVDAFQEVAEHIRELCRIECSQGCSEWERRRLDDTGDSVTLSFRCLCGRESKTMRMTFEEFGDYAYEVLRWKRRRDDDDASPVDHGPDGDT